MPRKKFKELSQTIPCELPLFQMRFDEDDETAPTLSEKELLRYSQTIGLYDAMPKFVWDTRSEQDENKQLEPIIREFKFGEADYTLVIKPAALTDIVSKKHTYHYPTAKDLLIEEVLRKLAVSGENTKFFDNQAGLTFTIYRIGQELKKFNHGASGKMIKRSLDVLSLTRMELYEGTGNQTRNKLTFSPIENLGFRDTSNPSEESDTFAVFSPFVTKSILEVTYRVYNYDQVMSYRSGIARCLHKRLAQNYTHANIGNNYRIKVSTLIQALGLTPQKRIEGNMRNIEDACIELMTGQAPIRRRKDESEASFSQRQIKEKIRANEFNRKPILLNYKFDKIHDHQKKNKVVDYYVTFQPSPAFITDTVNANNVENYARRIANKN